MPWEAGPLDAGPGRVHLTSCTITPTSPARNSVDHHQASRWSKLAKLRGKRGQELLQCAPQSRYWTSRQEARRPARLCCPPFLRHSPPEQSSPPEREGHVVAKHTERPTTSSRPLALALALSRERDPRGYLRTSSRAACSSLPPSPVRILSTLTRRMSCLMRGVAKTKTMIPTSWRAAHARPSRHERELLLRAPGLWLVGGQPGNEHEPARRPPPSNKTGIAGDRQEASTGHHVHLRSKTSTVRGHGLRLVLISPVRILKRKGSFQLDLPTGKRRLALALSCEDGRRQMNTSRPVSAACIIHQALDRKNGPGVDKSPHSPVPSRQALRGIAGCRRLRAVALLRQHQPKDGSLGQPQGVAEREAEAWAQRGEGTRDVCPAPSVLCRDSEAN